MLYEIESMKTYTANLLPWMKVKNASVTLSKILKQEENREKSEFKMMAKVFTASPFKILPRQLTLVNDNLAALPKFC